MATMTWEGPFVDIDPLILRIIVQIELEDSAQLAAGDMGKQRAGTMSDAQLAMQIYIDDLRSLDTHLVDRSMAQSVAAAVLQAGDLIAEGYRQAQQVARDRELAMRLGAKDSATTVGVTIRKGLNASPSTSQRDAWQDPEMLEKLTAI